MVRKRLKIFGLVQGVGFRYQSFSLAQTMNLVGWVKNNSDGSVSIEVQGEQQKIRDFIECLHTKIRFARIDRIEEVTIQLQSESSFKINQ
ncbi:MAG: acylphosphatase [Erysipelothrix sp.]|nr:acylphosphatase [Erysipelothrix sp.]